MSGRGMIAVALIAALALPAPALAAKKNNRREAAKLARRAKRHYQRGQYLEAAKLFSRSYDLSKVSSQLRNAAKSYERAEDFDEALKQWTRYRDLRSISRDERLEAVAHIDLINEKKRKAEVEKAVEAAQMAAEKAQLEAEKAKEAAVEATRAPPPPVAPPPPLIARTAPPEPSPVIAPWVLIGTGAALGIASAVLWFVAKSNYEGLQDRLAMRDPGGLVLGTSFEEADSDFAGINRNRTISGALLGTALAAVVAGGIWLTLDYTLD